MKKFLLTLLSLTLTISTFADSGDTPRKRQGAAAGYATRNATVLSMMGWGLSIAVGIAALSALVTDGNASSSSNSHSSSSSTSH